MDGSAAMEDPNDLSFEDIEKAYNEAVAAADAYDAEYVPTEEQIAYQESLADSDVADEADSAPLTEETAADEILNPVKIIEAFLFVGGEELTGKRLSSLLQHQFTPEQIDQFIERLNRGYLEEERPYTIRMLEGGYRMVLREEFEPIRQRVYGLAPKDVKLSQDALEALSFIAYRQPTTKADLDKSSGRGLSSQVNQLVKRGLIREAANSTKEDKRYETTSRFLQVFGLGHIRELPRQDDISFK